MADLFEAAREYQLEDATKLVKWGGRGILGQRTGLGKTFISLLTWKMLGEPAKVLVVGSGGAMLVWTREVKRWLGLPVIHITGSAGERAVQIKKARELMRDTNIPVFLVCNFDILRREAPTLLSIGFNMLIVDEAHKARNRKTVTWKVLKLFKVKHLLLASATMMSRGPQDIWGILHLLNPKFFSSYWRFISTFCHVIDGQFGKEIVGAKNAQQLWDMLKKHYYTTRTYEEVLPQLPPVTREVVELDFEEPSPQKRVYDDLDSELIANLGEEGEQNYLIVPNILAKVTRLRQLTICPWVLGVQDIGVELRYLVSAVEDDPHTVIFTPFADALEGIKNTLEKVEGVTEVFTLQGGTKPDEMEARIKAFKEKRGIMVCTISFAQSFSLDTTNTAYFMGFNWDPNDNTQAEGRLRRMDTQRLEGVVIKYLMVRGSIDDRVREVLNGKVMTVTQVMQDMRQQSHKSTIKKT